MAIVENLSTFQNFTKISIYTKNDEMNMFCEFQLKITLGSARQDKTDKTRQDKKQNHKFVESIYVSKLMNKSPD